ncbi:hypothetical protein K2173_010430 [Erythroxylum novogranatense]|uniref:Uncharacterized protein n=1 Tax=Erythroxylum novogranatense TaxID=1862640 RepID=A0AAV8TDU8_9ROSI|nr:hypothetical protein K2173_010430 [Erythroxylum novogranatense]
MAEAKNELLYKVEEAEEEAAAVEVWKYILGFSNIAVVKCAIELGIADSTQNHQGPNPITLSELASNLKCSPTSLHRIMRFLVHFRIFKEQPTTGDTIGYVQTPLSRRLLTGGENSMASFILLESSPVMLSAWHGLSASVRADGNPPFEAAHGQDLWKFAVENPGHSKLLDESMACGARVAVPAIIEGCPETFHGLKTLVDVGGGNGTTLHMLIKAYPWIHGINFDLPHVVSEATDRDGLSHTGGDMFHSVPKADAAFLMWVLHDWNDEECIQILKNCREAIPKDTGKVIIVEAVIGEDRNDKLEYVRLMLDMVMMAHTSSGKERTSKEWEFVLREAGFSRHIIKPIRAVQSVIEAFP